jgi:hypothetical protein
MRAPLDGIYHLLDRRWTYVVWDQASDRFKVETSASKALAIAMHPALAVQCGDGDRGSATSSRRSATPPACTALGRVHQHGERGPLLVVHVSSLHRWLQAKPRATPSQEPSPAGHLEARRLAWGSQAGRARHPCPTTQAARGARDTAIPRQNNPGGYC